VVFLRSKWTEVAATVDVRELARSLLQAHPLRAADSLQLAAAFVWCQRRPAGRTFISGDLRLCQAAALEGFTVIQVKP
jgi:predicted nucleic acid-binding protein